MTAKTSAPITRAVLITATEPEPRSFGKQVVLGGMLDHLCDRLGPEQVNVILIGRTDVDRPAVPYHLHVIEKPSAAEQLRAVVQRVLRPPHSSLQEAALWSDRVLATIAEKLAEIRADQQIWDTMRTGQYARHLGRKRRVLYADDLFSKRYASMLERIEKDPSKVADPLGEFGKLLPSAVGRIVGRKFVYRRLLQLEQKMTSRSEDRAPDVFDATFLVNAQESDELFQRTGNPTIGTLLPLLRDTVARERRWDGTPTFVFLGGLDFAPNRDASDLVPGQLPGGGAGGNSRFPAAHRGPGFGPPIAGGDGLGRSRPNPGLGRRSGRGAQLVRGPVVPTAGGQWHQDQGARSLGPRATGGGDPGGRPRLVGRPVGRLPGRAVSGAAGRPACPGRRSGGQPDPGRGGAGQLAAEFRTGRGRPGV